MTHAEMESLYELYVLGVLEPDLAAEIDAHLKDDCQECTAGVARATRVVAALSGLAEPVQPPPELRDRVLASVRRRPEVTPIRKPNRLSWLAPALAAACVILAVAAGWFGSQLNKAQDELATVRGERNQLRSALEILSKSDTRAVQFGRAQTVPHGRVLASRGGGLVFVGSNLPRLAANRTYQLWLVPNTGAPKSGGLFKPNAAGDSVQVSQIAANPAENKAVAVSIEPEGGSPAPTTTPIIVVPLS